MLEATIYLNDKPEGDMTGGFKDRLEDRAVQTSPAMTYFNDYKAAQVVDQSDEQEELPSSIMGKTVREPEVDALTQIYALDPQEPVVQETIQPEVDKPLLQDAWDMLPTGGQQAVWPLIAPFVKGAGEENPILRGMTEGALHDAPQGIVDMSRDVVNALGGEFKEEDWLKIPQILEANPDSTTEGVVRGLSQFMSVFGAAGGIGKGATLFKQMMAGGLADATFDPTGGNMATLLRELDMDNSLTQFLDSKVGEDADALERLEGRALQVLEGAGIGFAVGTLVGGLRWAKNNARELLQDSDPNLVPGVMKKFGIDMPQKDVVGDDYRMSHTAPSIEDPSLDDVTELFGDDIYGPQGARYYGHSGGDAADQKVVNTIQDMKGNPDAEITIYRAVPEGVDKINEGDWVTIDKDYAIQHGKHATDPSKDMPVIEMKVKAKELNSDGNSIFEWGYNPSTNQQPLTVYRSSTSGSYDKFDPSKQRTSTLGKGVYMFDGEKGATDWAGGHLQKIELPSDYMEKSINWGDGGQSDFVTKAFKNIEKEVDFKLDLEDGGIDVYPELVKNLGEEKAQALLLKHGIKGNRREGELTVFNVDDAKIVSTDPKDSSPKKPATSTWHETNEEFGDYKIGTNPDSDLGLHFGTREQGKARMDMIEGQIKAGHRTPPKNPVNSPKGRRMILNRLDIQNPLKLYENEAGSWDIPSVTRRIFEIEELPKGFSEADRKAWDSGTLAEKVTMDGKQVSVPVMPRVKPTSAEFSAISQGKARRVVTDANRYVKDLTVAQQTEWMDNFLKRRGYDAIEYENIYEGGGTSHAIFSLDKIKQVDSVRYAALVAPTGALTTKDSEANELSDFIKGYEKYKGAGYYATKSEEKEGLVTAGYGSTRRVEHGEKVTKEQAEKWLKEDIKKAHTTVDRLVKIKLNNNQKNALVSLVYNVGEGNFKKSKALKALNSGDIETFLKEAFDPKIGFVKAKKGGRILKGLVNRRSAEKKLFMKGTK
jgi:lysozyme